MCLKLKNVFVFKRTAKEDIVCYKHVRQGYVRKDLFFTRFQDAEIKIGETYKSKLRKDFLISTAVSVGLHSYKNIEDCEALDTLYFVVKCVIPKGAKYYTGFFGEDCVSYASNKLTYVEIVSEPKYGLSHKQ